LPEAGDSSGIDAATFSVETLSETVLKNYGGLGEVGKQSECPFVSLFFCFKGRKGK
jgi:hypothetical protein